MADTPKSNLVTNADQAWAFLNWLSPNGPYRIETIVSEGNGRLGVRTFRDNQGEELRAFVEEQNSANAKRNIYFLPNAPRLTGDRKKENLRGAEFLHVDLDMKDYPGNESEQFDRIVELLMKNRPKGIPAASAVWVTDANYGISAHVLDQPKPLDYAKRQVVKAKQYLDEDGGGKPEIFVLPGRLPQAVDQAEQALIAADVPIFQRFDDLVRVVRLPDGSNLDDIKRSSGALILRPVAHPWLKEQYAIYALWVRPSKDNKKVPMDPPPDSATAYLARVGDWKLRFLRGITQTPTLRSDGSVLQEPGYDPASAVLYDPGDMVFPPIPENPSKEEAAKALEILEQPFRKFCFAQPVDKSVALAAVLTALVRHMFPSAPLFLIEAPTAGTGKSLFSETLGIIAMGHKPAMMSQGKTAEEQEKRLSSVLMAGDLVIVIDNCDRPIEGDFLCSMVTQEWVQPRILGKSEVRRLATCSVVIATGNNPTVAGDMTRRVFSWSSRSKSGSCSNIGPCRKMWNWFCSSRWIEYISLPSMP